MHFSFWPAPAQDFETVLDLARHAEATGWDGVWYADHFMPNAEDTSQPWPECWVTLSALAPLVPRLRLGTLVCGNTYRHPAVLAKMAATLDHVSGGRFVLGLGAGWQENEHRQYGIPFHTTRERLERLDEACAVIKALYTQEKSDFEGRYYQLSNASLEPKPRQDPLPLLVGGGGEKVTLRIAARWADEWNVWGTPETLAHKVSVLEAHCRDLGRDPKSIRRSAQALVFLGDDPAWLERMRGTQTPMAKIVGTPAELREVVARYAEAGVDELIVPDFTLGHGDAKKRAMDRIIGEVAGR
ncbi:MAG: LLM class F420-dependent oxidoreductase [Pseudomonadales bacterium]|jgi:F420-dependent oxidoreductase-like protein|nr:LLM class F420-dependent oxidoreductase [Pseudomonadales bacterium]